MLPFDEIPIDLIAKAGLRGGINQALVVHFDVRHQAKFERAGAGKDFIEFTIRHCHGNVQIRHVI